MNNNLALIRTQQKYLKERNQPLNINPNVNYSNARKQVNAIQRVGETALDVGGNVIGGAAGTVEGVVDFALSGVGLVGGIFDKNFQDKIRKIVETDFTQENILNPLGEITKNSYINDASVRAQKTIRGIASGVGQIIPSVAVAGITGGSSLASTLTFGLGAAGRSTQEAFQDNSSYEGGMLYGTLSGLSEVAIERLSGGIGKTFLGKGVIDSSVNTILRKKITSPVARNIAKIGISALGEAGEEAIAEIINPILKISYKGFEDFEMASLEDIVDSAVIGAGTSLAFGSTFGRINARSQNINEYSQEIRDIEKADKLSLSNKDILEFEKALDDINIDISFELKKIKDINRPKVIQALSEMGYQWFNEDGSIDYERFELGKQEILNNNNQVNANFDIESLEETTKNKINETQKLYNSFKEINPDISKVLFDNTLPTNISGKYDAKTDTIHINPNADNLFNQILKHELTHSLEGTKHYDNLVGYAVKHLKETGEYNTLRKEVESLYQDELANLSLEEKEAYINEEITSNFSERLFENEESIRKLVNSNKSLAQRIYEWIKEKLSLLTGKLSKEELAIKKQLETSEKLFKNALSERVKSEETKYKKTSSNDFPSANELLSDVDTYFDIEQSGLFDENIEENFKTNYNEFIKGTLEDVEIQSYFEDLLGVEMPDNVVETKSTLKPKTEETTPQKNLEKTVVSDTLKSQETVETKASRFQDKSVPEWAYSEMIDEKAIKEIESMKSYYVPETDAKAKAYVANELKDLDNNYDLYVERYISDIENGKIKTKQDIAVGIELIKESIKKEDWNNYFKLSTNLTLLATELGQQVQAFSLLKKLTPKGELYYLEQYVKRYNAKNKQKNITLKINKQLETEFLKAENNEQKNQVLDKIETDLANQIPTTIWDKINQWRYLAMLGNPKTHVRNFVSNTIMSRIVKLKNKIGRAIESGMIKRGKMGESDRVYGKVNKNLIDYATKDSIEVMDRLQGGSSKYNQKSKVEEKRQIFNSKLLEQARRFNYNMLEKADVYALKKMYSMTLASYMDAKGHTAETYKNNPKLLEQAREYAIAEAQKATFRQFSSFANLINNLKAKSKLWEFGLGGVIPFTKTPINILRTGVNYSPIGLVNSVFNNGRKLKSGEITINQYIDSISQGLTGSMIMALGFLLSQLGVISGGDDEDNKAENYKKNLGKQNYSINILGKSYTLDWLSPSAMPLFMGVALEESFSGDGNSNIEGMIGAIASSADPLTELSMLSGLNNTLKTYSNNRIQGMAIQTIKNYGSQFFPTLGSQIAKTFDNTRRTTAATKNTKSGMSKELEQYINYLKSKTPFLAQTLEPYVNVWGEIETDPNILNRALENMVYPFWVNENKINNIVDNEIMKIYEQTGNNEIIPRIPNPYYTINGERYDMSIDEYTQYKISYGKTSKKLLNNLMKSSYYQNLSIEQKEEIIPKVYDYARLITRKDEKLYDLYSSIGNNLISYILEINAFEADKDSDGNSIQGSKKLKVFNYINKLPLSKLQKNSLFKYFGYSTSSDNNKKTRVIRP